jgi:hypothetical protein
MFIESLVSTTRAPAERNVSGKEQVGFAPLELYFLPRFL